MRQASKEMINRIFILLISGYQKISRYIIPPCCRFTPTCSEYARQAFQKYGFIRAIFLSVKRVVRCNPYNPGGYDPLP